MLPKCIINALEKAVKTAENATQNHIEYDDVKSEDIKSFLGAFVK